MREMKDSGIEWIGEIPVNWDTGKTLYALSMPITDGPHETPELLSEGIPFVSAEAVSCGNGYIDFSHIRGYISKEFYMECCKKYIPQIHDIYMIKSGATTGRVAKVDTDKVFTIWSPLAVFRCDEERCYYNYFYYFIQSDAYQKQIENKWTYGTQQNIGMRTLEKLIVCFPPILEQHRISTYLDTKCTKIDSIIEKQEKVIEKLKAYKLSVITEAVTKGPNPDVKMKESGVEWIGEIPEDYNLIKLKYLISFIESGVSVNAGQNEADVNEIGVLKTSSVSKFAFDIHENKSVNKNEENRVSCPVCSNTLIISRMNTPELVGACGYVDKSYSNIFLPDRLWQVHFKTHTNVKYIWYYLRSKCVRFYISSLSTGTSSSMQNISQSQLGNINIVLPTSNQQSKIADYLDKKCSAIDSTIEKKQAVIEKLKEYKKSLIYEVVTGKREV